MPQTYLVFDFGTNEDAVQQARHKLGAWKQAFRLDKKLLFKFERTVTQEKPATPVKPEAPAAAKKTKGVKNAKDPEKTKPEEQTEAGGSVRLLVRVDFSDHERLSYHRWVERIPKEEPFAAAAPKSIAQGEGQFAETKELFERLD
ncbi:MAG: hypothetical protein ABSF92_06590 [Candidatus Acidiferrales bacterium]|jgi:hypothetical protein